MHAFIRRYNYFLGLIFLFLASEVVVNPIGNFPLNDDWSYGKSVLFTVNDHFTIGDFASMSLFSHVMWGVLFTKLFGFSFTVLRFSTLISAIISSFFLYNLVMKITSLRSVSFMICLTLLFNPLYFNLTNTFMTDVNFNTLMIVSCYSAYQFFDSKKIMYMLLFFLICAGMVLIRQYGIIAPVCFVIACTFIKDRKWFYVLFSLIGTLFVALVFRRYEEYLHTILSAGATYRFSGNVHFLSGAFWKLFFESVSSRYKLILLYTLISISPAALLFLPALARVLKKQYTLASSFLCFGAVYLLFKNQAFPYENILTNMCLGPETFYEHKGHAYSEGFGQACTFAKFLLSGVTLWALCLYFATSGKMVFKVRQAPNIVFLMALAVTYLFMMLVTETYFDRHQIPLFSIFLILLAYLGRRYALTYWYALIPLACFFYVSILGTRDYLTLNRIRWQAFDDVKKQAKVQTGKINGGFEVNCWNDGNNNWWYDYYNLAQFDYLIQFKNEKGFRLQTAYEFQRYFPYKKDTINLYTRDEQAHK